MCKISDYAGLYLKAEGILRHQGLNPKTPGFEMLKVAILIYKVEGYKYVEEKDENNFFENVEKTILSPIPSINQVNTNRHPVEQWIVESLRAKGIEDSPMSFIKDMANQI